MSARGRWRERGCESPAAGGDVARTAMSLWRRVLATASMALALTLTVPLVSTIAGQGAARAAEPEAAPHGAEATAAEAAGGHEAGEHEGPSIDAKKLALQFLNFGVLVFILVKFGGGAINKALAARHHQLKADLAAAAELRASAEAKLAKQEARLASLEHEIAELRSGIKAEADAEKARLIAAAEERAERIKTETAFLVEQQVRAAQVSLRREAADAALSAAEEILRRTIGIADQKNLMDTFIADIEQPGPTARASLPASALASASAASASAPRSGDTV